jgi:hypothetical protein
MKVLKVVMIGPTELAVAAWAAAAALLTVGFGNAAAAKSPVPHRNARRRVIKRSSLIGMSPTFLRARLRLT